jgi:hypothetical protein
MANAADLALSIQSGDDADLTNPVDITENIPVYVDDVRQDDAKAHTISDDSGVFTVVFCIPPILIPDGKFIGLTFGDSNAANILSALVLDDTYHENG